MVSNLFHDNLLSESFQNKITTQRSSRYLKAVTESSLYVEGLS